MKFTFEDGMLCLFPKGRIDSTNAADFEQELTRMISEHPGAALVLDAAELDYISSAGLRVLLRQRKAQGEELTVRNVSPALYEIFEITGFTSLLNVEKALRFLSVAGLEQLGAGVHSTVYRLDGESILKVVKDMTLEAIRAEMQVSKKALFHGVPTAISYDVVRTEEGYGEVYELFRAGVLSAAVMAEPERREEYLDQFVAMYRQIHSVEIGEGELDSVRDRYLAAAEALAPLVSPEELTLVRRMIEAVPEGHSFIHGDFHMNNVMLQDGELLLIDVGEAGRGHPLFDFAQTEWAYLMATDYSPERCERVTGMSLEEARYVHKRLFPLYFGAAGDAAERKLAVVNGMAMLRRLLIPFLQNWNEASEAVCERLPGARQDFFPRINALCELIKSEF
ncbi:MAG: anti-sigma factor antagonist [Oscillospiraceae bacterium]|nr:anti-sigma factor antagonist [Oscillospiraceae bacterium]